MTSTKNKTSGNHWYLVYQVLLKILAENALRRHTCVTMCKGKSLLACAKKGNFKATNKHPLITMPNKKTYNQHPLTPCAKYKSIQKASSKT